MKKCSKCSQIKSPENFDKSAKTKDGLGSYCKTCRAVVTHIRYIKNKSEIKEAARAYYRKNREKKLKYQKHYDAKRKLTENV